MTDQKNKKFRLRNLEIDRIDHVDQGANQHAHIRLTKAFVPPVPGAPEEEDPLKKPQPPKTGFVPQTREGLAGQVRSQLGQTAPPQRPAQRPVPATGAPALPGGIPTPGAATPPVPAPAPGVGAPGLAPKPMAPPMAPAAPGAPAPAAPGAPPAAPPAPAQRPGMASPSAAPGGVPGLAERLSLLDRKKKAGSAFPEQAAGAPVTAPVAKRDPQALRRQILAVEYILKQVNGGTK